MSICKELSSFFFFGGGGGACFYHLHGAQTKNLKMEASAYTVSPVITLKTGNTRFSRYVSRCLLIGTESFHSRPPAPLKDLKMVNTIFSECVVSSPCYEISNVNGD
jgi:hypothetical protein